MHPSADSRAPARRPISKASIRATLFKHDKVTTRPSHFSGQISTRSTNTKRRTKGEMQRNRRTSRTTKTNATEYSQHQTRTIYLGKRNRRIRGAANTERDPKTRGIETIAKAEWPKPKATRKTKPQPTPTPSPLQEALDSIDWPPARCYK